MPPKEDKLSYVNASTIKTFNHVSELATENRDSMFAIREIIE